MLNKINWNIAIPILLIVLASAVSSWLLREKPTMQRGERKAPPLLVEVTQAERGEFPLTIQALGKVTAREEVELQPQVDGRVEWLNYDLGPGSTVEKGQRLLQIEREPYQLALQSARSALAERRAELQQEQGQRLVAEEEYELLGSSLPDADLSLVLREPQLAAARARVDAAEAQVKLAERDLRLTQISAPFNALLVARSVDVGDRVAPGTIMYTVAGADRFQIEVEVPARQLPQLNTPSAKVRIHGSQWPLGASRAGEFVRVIPVLEEQGRLGRVLIELADPLSMENPAEPRLLLNDLARVEITGRSAGQQVRIPLTALQDGNRVWIVKDGKLHIQPVVVSHFDGEFAVLQSGLQGGEELVTTRLTAVTENMPVRTKKSAAPAAQRVNPELRRRGKAAGARDASAPPELPERTPESVEKGTDGERG
ncbi:efflux RND transporter periplasmic adaptor subunit [Microbulbifer agarilyticus]|uniref:efflux RND transporter periplasmic adaptor subunit n=1 Tax=Microbulbifer agarilyticus TaxID=260552 RepID=UPI001C93E906|nr:efflux RND transporter periplasmic adaptor subunit [Microbulbifer agarilyticus]MBY6189479.1 efflux RND transporter periplasmic adaptor subunit [Microbulbifer agarilyticus]MCA0891966.1 efflux RND transporter periplasmic adaptor subunit [Microbulbifer agarilyticus]